MGQIVQPVFRIYVLCYHANDKCFTMKVAGDTPSPWCHNEPPLAYSYIQKVILIYISLFSLTLVTGSLGQRFPRLLGHQTVAQLPAGSALCPHGPSSLLGICSGWKSNAKVSSTHCQHVGALGLCKEVRFGGQQLAWDAKKALPGR